MPAQKKVPQTDAIFARLHEVNPEADQADNVLRNLPPRTLVKSFLDYFWVRITERFGWSHHSDDNFEGWVTKRFGRTLYDLFFGRYTGKTWKMPPSEISGDWASQRISQLDLADDVDGRAAAGTVHLVGGQAEDL